MLLTLLIHNMFFLTFNFTCSVFKTKLPSLSDVSEFCIDLLDQRKNYMKLQLVTTSNETEKNSITSLTYDMKVFVSF